jgi:hypothetical protein
LGQVQSRGRKLVLRSHQDGSLMSTVCTTRRFLSDEKVFEFAYFEKGSWHPVRSPKGLKTRATADEWFSAWLLENKGWKVSF